MRAGLDVPLPPELAVGAGTVVLVAGWCDAPDEPVLTVDGEARPLLAARMPRLDVPAYRAGFWGLAEVREGAEGEVSIGLRAAAGEVELGRIPIRSRRGAGSPRWPGGDGPRVAIAMATFDPPDDLLRAQLDSIRAQTHANWVCVISDDHSREERFAALRAAVGDDSRFVVSRASRRRGFYENFERALELVPADAEFVALADQDDVWHPDKLATLLEHGGDARLVYSDCRVVARDGSVVSETFWDTRANNHRDLLSQLVANAVTGAAALFPRDLLDDALPFPPGPWRHYHDHWLGVVALATGRIAYVDRPLYDYVQHTTATIGHEGSTRMPSLADRWRALRDDGRERVRLWRAHYFGDTLRLVVLARIVLLRAGHRMPARRRRTLERFARETPGMHARLLARGARELARRRTGRPETLGAEWMLAYTLLWRRLLALTARDVPQRRGRLDALPPPGLGQQAGRESVTLPGDVAGMADKIAPLDLRLAAVAPRVNVLIPALDLEHFFGGYIGKLNLALRLARRGHAVRVVLTDVAALLPADRERARAAVERYAGLAGFFDAVEVVPGRGLGGLEVAAGDRFVATTWWTAHVARAATEQLGGPPFLYLIQEHEPFTFPAGSWAALAEQSYRFEHRALYSTELLRDWFGDHDAPAFRNAITDVRPPAAEVLVARSPRRLLFYARPEPHAARNLYELGVLALHRALADGAFAGWELRGIGTTSLGRSVRIGDATLELLPRTAQADYAALLGEHDVGLALMHTPHPSLVPIEMAAAGLVTVTSAFANKTAEAMAAISPNLLAAEPTVEGIAAALRDAQARAGDVPARLAGADVRWPRSWDAAFDEALLARVEALLQIASGA